MTSAIDVRPLAVADLWVLLAAKNRPLRWPAYLALLREVAGGRVMGGFVDGVPVVMGAVQTFDDLGPRIAWVDAVGSSDLPPRFILRAIAAYLDRVGCDRVVAWVAVDQVKHQRFVRLNGFTPTGTVVAGMEMWRHEHADRQDGETAVCTGGSIAAAAGIAAG